MKVPAGRNTNGLTRRKRMLEKIKEVPFIDESTAVKVTSDEEGKVVLERYDRVIWAREVWSLREPVHGLACYVEAAKLLSLLEK